MLKVQSELDETKVIVVRASLFLLLPLFFICFSLNWAATELFELFKIADFCNFLLETVGTSMAEKTNKGLTQLALVQINFSAGLADLKPYLHGLRLSHSFSIC